METSREYVHQKFTDYYRNPSTVISCPPNPDQREFGYLLFKERFMVRHKHFTNIKALLATLTQTIPSDVYHSCAYYENPDFDMDKKGWVGSDLVFDIDADHLPTTCNKIHDEFKCSKCGFTGRGIVPESCPCCETTKFENKIWACDLCIRSAREETAKLIDILENDFGISPNELRVFFSGHRGYHIHVENEIVRSLDAMARKEIVDYVTGLGLSILEKEAKQKKSKTKTTKFILHNFGWNKRLKIGMHNLLQNATNDDFKAIGIKNKALLENKDAIIRRALTEGKWESIPGVSTQTWRKLASYIRENRSSKIDTVVTTDIHRLIRMNGTLHGKTGLLKVEFPATKLQEFDPFTEAVAFKKGEVKVFVSEAPEFRLEGQTIGPFKNQTVILPTAAAILLICKRRAEVAL
jgi:DNA primase small subunit